MQISVNSNRNNFDTNSVNFTSLFSRFTYPVKTPGKCDELLCKLSDYSPKYYGELSNREIKELRRAVNSNKEYERITYIHNILANCIKEFLDKKYGESNYIIINLGRSLSSVCKLLGYKIGNGKVKQIPMSNSDYFLTSLPKKKKQEKFVRFLNSVGIGRKQLKKSDKQYVILDYAYTGDSLKGAKKFFNYILGNRKNLSVLAVDENFFAQNRFDVLDKLSDDKKKIAATAVNELFHSRYKFLSFVKKCPNISKASTSFVNIDEQNLKTKFIWFKLLDDFMQKK